MYRDELLERSLGREEFNELACQLVRCYPQLKHEIQARQGMLSKQWEELELLMHASCGSSRMESDHQQSAALWTGYSISYTSL